jgi:divinyl chlorophyllide a 8-vinyl-reductase
MNYLIRERIAYKVMTAADVAALDAGVFNGAPVDIADGFIHLSTAAQLAETIRRHFSGRIDLTIVAVDLSMLGDLVRWEPSRNAEFFPHVYGALSPASIIGRCAWIPDAGGSIRLPIPPPRRRIFVLGATGTIGRATVRALVRRGHEVVCFARPRAGRGRGVPIDDAVSMLAGAEVRFGHIRDIARVGFRGERFDVLMSCMASRNGAAVDAWAVDHQAHVEALEAARGAGVAQVVLLSAICVQKPLLAFQRAKLMFEKVLRESGLTYSIVRPTAFFKSLSGQIDRVKGGRPFLLFGDGTLTACKPISDDDLATYLCDCLHEPDRWNRILPIGGPGDPITPRQQGEHLFALVGRPPRFRQVPVVLLDVIIGILSILGRVVPQFAAKAELARIGRYYATESMLVLNPDTGRYDAASTPSTGTETLLDFYADVIRGGAAPERGDHSVFRAAKPAE